MRNIGIVCEGPTDYLILREVVDQITGENNYYVQLQPEPDLTGACGNGWKGVWKWCKDNAYFKEQLMKDIEPSLDILIIQMDGDVSRKEKIAHCLCESNLCEYKGDCNPLECDADKEMREICPIVLPCDSIEAWIVAAYDELENAEQMEDPWISIISRKKTYHDIRIAGDKKRKRVYEQFVDTVCANWNKVTKLCLSAKRFEENIILFTKKEL